MFARQFITDSIPPVRPKDEIKTVLDWMSEFKITHLPVVDGDQLLGIVSENELLETTSAQVTIGELNLGLNEKVYVYEDNHVFDVMRLMLENRTDIAPVLSARDNSYLGLINRESLLNAASTLLNAHEPGGVIVLEVPHNSYSLSEIGRICENNEAKVLSLTVSPGPQPHLLNVTLKLNLRDVSRVLATFERFDYTIAHVIFDSDQLDDYRERYENLIRYLNL